jgi:hypothetical protein
MVNQTLILNALTKESQASFARSGPAGNLQSALDGGTRQACL